MHSNNRGQRSLHTCTYFERRSRQHFLDRIVKISGTRTTLSFYWLNLEKLHLTWKVRITNHAVGMVRLAGLLYELHLASCNSQCHRSFDPIRSLAMASLWIISITELLSCSFLFALFVFVFVPYDMLSNFFITCQGKGFHTHHSPDTTYDLVR